MAVTISGMFGNNKTYFADSPVIININGLHWGNTTKSPFTIARINVIYKDNIVGSFHADTGGQSSISFDISSALRSIWADYDFNDEVSKALIGNSTSIRAYRAYSLEVLTEYIDSTDGEFTQTSSGKIEGGRCAIGSFTEWERSIITNETGTDVSYREHSNLRNGDASTKPISSPERVGKNSITSWVDVSTEGTQSSFYVADVTPEADKEERHAPIVIRDTQKYQDFLFVNRRGAVETCSALMQEAMGIEVEMKQYSRVERPIFQPSRSLLSLSKGGRRSWAMSSGYQTREWVEWWAMEFLTARRWWMLYKGRYVPVIVKPGKENITIYDKNKQQMSSVEFTVTLALEG